MGMFKVITKGTKNKKCNTVKNRQVWPKSQLELL